MKRTTPIVIAIIVLLVASAVMAQPASQTVKPTPRITNTPRIKVTVTPSRTPTKTVTPSRTATVTPSKTVTVMPSHTNTPVNTMQTWHAPGAHDGLNIHEHGNVPPAWVTEWSMTNFGHGLIFGGDEISSPMENSHKHTAYKGHLAILNDEDSNSANNAECYFRFHAASNPADRLASLHSYEVYCKDASNNVSFWQGLNFPGYPEIRSQRFARHDEAGRAQFSIGSPDEVDFYTNFIRCEQWYTTGGRWAWDLGFTICESTTLFSYGEHLNDPMNPATWELTGGLGLDRRIEVSHYGDAVYRDVAIPLDAWYCVSKYPLEDRAAGATPVWTIAPGTVTTPDACPALYLPQWKASTMPSVVFPGNEDQKLFPGTGIITVPN